MASSPKKSWWARRGRRGGETISDPHFVDVWEGEGGRCGEPGETAHVPPPVDRLHRWSARRGGPAGRAAGRRGWVSFLALGVGIATISLLERARQR